MARRSQHLALAERKACECGSLQRPNYTVATEEFGRSSEQKTKVTITLQNTIIDVMTGARQHKWLAWALERLHANGVSDAGQS
jgi:hypothetical protein